MSATAGAGTLLEGLTCVSVVESRVQSVSQSNANYVHLGNETLTKYPFLFIYLYSLMREVVK